MKPKTKNQIVIIFIILICFGIIQPLVKSIIDEPIGKFVDSLGNWTFPIGVGIFVVLCILGAITLGKYYKEKQKHGINNWDTLN